MQHRLRICLAQLAVTSGEVEANLAKIVQTIERYQKSDLIVFPELVVHGHLYSTLPRADIVEILRHTPPLDAVREAARRHAVRVILGSIEERDGRLYNVAVYLGRDSTQSYAKTHVHWTEQFDPGESLQVFDSSLDKIGPLICYDAAFPECARALALQGARLITVIAAVPSHFDSLVMSRRMQSIAVMNQVFVVYVNRGGEDFLGGSGAWSPRGDVVGRVGRGEHFLEVEIDLLEVDRWREQEPLFPHRRPDLYASSYPIEAK